MGRIPGIRHLFGLRGPRSLEILAGYFGVREDRIISIRQVHGDSILVIDASSDEGTVEAAGQDGDAVVTNDPGVVLTVRTADCLPILIWDAEKNAVGAIHAGWRGSLKAVASKAVSSLQAAFGSRPRDLRVGIGPAAGPCCYEVDRPVLELLRERFDFWRDVVREKGNGKGMLDLPGLNVRQLVGAGVSPDRIEAADACTVCHSERFYSFRRDGTASGGMLSGIMILDENASV